MKRTNAAVAVAVSAMALVAIAGCSSSAGSSGTTSAPAAASSAPAADPNQPSAEIVALCDKTVADKMSQADAEAAVAAAGFTSRIGSVDGEPKPLTMDYRLDRMTFDIENGVVTACQVG